MSDIAKQRFYLLKEIAKACREFNLIEAEDRIVVGVSGGKDSFALLELLVAAQRDPKLALPGGPYSILAVHVDGSAVGLPDLKPALQPWFEALGVPYAFVPLELKDDEPRPPSCFRCAFNRRKALFQAAQRFGCNKVALAHHADDAAATTLLNLLQQGRVESLPPRRVFFGGLFTVIRPLIYVKEQDLARYARACGWESAPEATCPHAHMTRRQHVAAFLASFGRDQNQLRANLWRAAWPETQKVMEEG